MPATRVTLKFISILMACTMVAGPVGAVSRLAVDESPRPQVRQSVRNAELLLREAFASRMPVSSTLTFAVGAQDEKSESLLTYGGLGASTVQPEVVSPPPAGFNIENLRLASFMAERKELLSSLDSRNVSSYFDLAEFYLGHRMVAEGRALLKHIEKSDLSSEQVVRRDAVDGALSILAGEPPRAASLFSTDGPDWPGRDLWILLAASRGLVEEPPQEIMTNAVSILTSYPEEFRNDFLLDFLEMAVNAESEDAKKILAKMVEAAPEVSRDKRYILLAGMASAKSGNQDDAIALYREAASGTGRSSLRARILLADIGLEDGSPENLTSAAKMLEEARHDWRGSPEELGLLVRLAQAYEGMLNLPKAASVMGDILAYYPGTPEAALAQRRAYSILSRLYEAGRDGEITLEQLAIFHRRNAIEFRSLDGFPELIEMFADTLHEAGASAAAAAEYLRARDLVLAQNPHADTERLAGLDLARADALLSGGQMRAALDLTEKMIPTGIREIDDQRARLAAIAASALGKPDHTLAMVMQNPTADHLRDQAEAARQAGNWEVAIDMLSELSKNHADTVTFEDAVAMLIAAKRGGDDAVAQKALLEITRTSGAPGHDIIAQSVLKKNEDAAPLKRNSARKWLADSGDALRELTSLESSSVSQ